MDADYKFIRAEDGQLRIPNVKNSFPMVFIGDDAFPLKMYLMKPYRSRNLSVEQLIFNYRLSRARRVVENAFGILSSRFRVISNTMLIYPTNVKKVVLSCFIMHNLLRTQSTTARDYILNHVDSENLNTGEIHEGSWRSDQINLTQLETNRSNIRSSTEAMNLRENLCNYFNTNGAVPFQNNIIHH